MEKKIPVKTLYLLLIISIGLIGLGIGGTYAVFVASAEIVNPIVLNSNLSYTDNVMETISVTVAVGETKSTTLNITNSSGSSVNYVIWCDDKVSAADIDIGVSSGSSVGSLANGDSTSVIVDIRNKSSNDITIILGTSSNAGSVVLGSDMRQVPNSSIFVPLYEYITNLYTVADKTVVINNTVEYNYASSAGLMNDRLGGTTTEYDAGNIRYYGKTPNNYIYFNCSDYTNQSDTTCEKWRIIGVFDDKVKIIRGGSIGGYAWDNKNTSTGAEDNYGKNDWTTARLMKLLNPSDYYTIDSNDNGYGQSLYYNAGSGTCYSGSDNATKSCDFTSTGIKNAITRNMIAQVTWNLGSWGSVSVYSDQVYGYERGKTTYSGRPKSWPGKIALAYPSDYGYAADFNSCKEQLNNYSDSTCADVNWMKQMINGQSDWLLTSTTASGIAWHVVSTNSLGTWYVNSGSVQVWPVLHLNSGLKIESGNGSSEKPYRLIVG